MDEATKEVTELGNTLLYRGPLIEALVNLDRLPPRCFFIALPLKIKGGSGSPVRPVALVPRS